jgi:urease accessory protein
VSKTEFEWQHLAYLLQVSNANFPTGGFNHSYGLETLLSWGVVSSSGDLEGVTNDWIRYGVAPVDGAGLALAYKLYMAGDWEGIVQVDQTLSANKFPAEAAAASVKVGSAAFRALGNVFDGKGVHTAWSMERNGELHGNQSVVFGIACADEGVPIEPAVESFLHAGVNNLVSVAARLVPLGQLDAQKVLRNCWAAIVEGREIAMARDLESMGGMCALWDVAGMEHESLEVRLCIS